MQNINIDVIVPWVDALLARLWECDFDAGRWEKKDYAQAMFHFMFHEEDGSVEQRLRALNGVVVELQAELQYDEDGYWSSPSEIVSGAKSWLHRELEKARSASPTATSLEQWALEVARDPLMWPRRSQPSAAAIENDIEEDLEHHIEKDMDLQSVMSRLEDKRKQRDFSQAVGRMRPLRRE